MIWLNKLASTGWITAIMVAPAVLLVGCAGSNPSERPAGTTGPSTAPVHATSTAPASSPATPQEAKDPVPERTNPTPTVPPYSVEVAVRPLTIRASDGPGTATFTVHNNGPSIPALSLWLDGPEDLIQEVRSDRTRRPLPTKVDRGQGWDFGPLPKGATTRITLTLSARQAGDQRITIHPFAIAEDEGDALLSVDAPMPQAETSLVIHVLPPSIRKSA